VLPPQAKTYFTNLWSAAATDASTDLASKQKAFRRDIFAGGQGPNSGRFIGGLANLYKESLSARALAIVEALKKMHTSFNSPLDSGTEAQLLEWGAEALSGVQRGFEGAFERHMKSFGVQSFPAVGLDHANALAQATVVNLTRRHLEELRNVPAMRPQEPTTDPASVLLKRELKPMDFESLLHAVIVKSSLGLYRDGHLREAVLNGVTAVFDMIRGRTGLDLDGTALVGQAFGLEKGKLIFSEVESESGQSDQKGFLKVFEGIYTGVRNVKAHSLSHDLNEMKAAQYLVMMSLLARRVDECNDRPQA